MPSSPIHQRRNRWIFLSCWLIWAGVHYTLLLQFGIPDEIALGDAFISNMLLALALLFISHTLGFYRPSKNKYLFLFAWCLAVAGIWSVLIKYGLNALFSYDSAYHFFLMKSMPVRFNIAFLMTGSATINCMLWYHQEEQKVNESRKLSAEKLEKDAELYKLRQQLQPHFLFNSLNSISALAGSDPEQARKMIQQLSDFLRAALKKEDHQWISLSEELQHLQLYLDMEKMRFGHRLSTQVVHDDESMRLLMPPMLLQPIVENAIKFGLYDTTGQTNICIDATADIDGLVITVRNPFDTETASPKQGTGFGLSSVQRRLYLLFARNDLLTTSVNGNIFQTTVKIPRHDNEHTDR